MRRKDRRITENESFSLLEEGEYGVLCTASAEGEPYGVPLNYCVVDRCIYFHCATEGRKCDNIAGNPRVLFCVVGRTEVLPEQFSMRYESVFVTGLASEADDDEKQLALEALVNKYSGDFFEQGLAYIEKLCDKTKVVKVTIESISGKARR